LPQDDYLSTAAHSETPAALAALSNTGCVSVPSWWTDIDTWAKRPDWVDDVDLEFDEDGVDDHDQIVTVKAPSKKKKEKKKPTPAYGYDEEGAPIFTRDRDARWGHRSATSSRKSGS
jgi:hypothetical protein